MNENAGMPAKAQVQFDCKGHATGKMRNDLEVMMKQPFKEGPFIMATDEGSFHGGDATGPPPPWGFLRRVYRVEKDTKKGRLGADGWGG